MSFLSVTHTSRYFMFQSTSSEEDVVSLDIKLHARNDKGFNPRPPKRTLCRVVHLHSIFQFDVSIHVLRRGRCVPL